MKKNPLASAILMAGMGFSTLSAAVEIEEVIVTAQKRQQSSQDVPIAMDAFSTREIEERGIDDVSDLSMQTPSLQYGEAAGNTQLSIRGIGFNIFAGAGENSVAVHSDGLYIANPGALALLQSDIASIEVLKGPQGTLWGRNATAGVVNFITDAPRDELSGSVMAGYGKYNEKNFSADLNLPINEKIRSRVLVSSNNRDGYIKNPNVKDDLMGNSQLNTRISLDIDNSESLQTQIRLFSADRELDGPLWDPVDDRILAANPVAFAGKYDTDPYRSLTTKQPKQDESLRGGSVRFIYDINDNITLSSITGHVDFDRKQDGLDMDGTSYDSVSLNRGSRDKTYSQEFNLSGNTDNMDWLVGAFYLKQSLTATNNIDPAALRAQAPDRADIIGESAGTNTYAVLDSFMFDFEEDVESLALFADSTYNLREDLRIFGGVRWMQEERKLKYTDTYSSSLWTGTGAPFTNTGTTVTVVACDNYKNTEKVKDITGRLGLQVDLSENSMLYAQASNGFKSGGHNTASCKNSFEPESLNALEVGIKSTLLDNQLRFNGAIFAYDYTDLQVEEIVGNASLINNADAKVLGAEFDVLYYATESVKLNAGVTLLDTKFTKFSNIDTINDPTATRQDLSGNPLLRSPEWSAVLGAQYDWYSPSGFGITLRTDINSSAAYQLREFDHPADEQDSYTMVNASARFLSADEHWEMVAWVKNLTNEKVLYSLINANTLGGQGWASGVWSEPRTFGIDAKYHF